MGLAEHLIEDGGFAGIPPREQAPHAHRVFIRQGRELVRVPPIVLPVDPTDIEAIDGQERVRPGRGGLADRPIDVLQVANALQNPALTDRKPHKVDAPIRHQGREDQAEAAGVERRVLRLAVPIEGAGLCGVDAGEVDTSQDDGWSAAGLAQVRPRHAQAGQLRREYARRPRCRSGVEIHERRLRVVGIRNRRLSRLTERWRLIAEGAVVEIRGAQKRSGSTRRENGPVPAGCGEPA